MAHKHNHMGAYVQKPSSGFSNLFHNHCYINLHLQARMIQVRLFQPSLLTNFVQSYLFMIFKASPPCSLEPKAEAINEGQLNECRCFSCLRQHGLNGTLFPGIEPVAS